MHAILLLAACNLLVNSSSSSSSSWLVKREKNDDHAVNFQLYKIVELEHNKKSYNGREIYCAYRYKSLLITI